MYSSQHVLEFYLVKSCYEQKSFKAIFTIKVRVNTCFYGIFAGRLGGSFDSQATNRSAPGGGVGLTESPPCFLLVSGESYLAPSRTAIRVF
jgi:hypothetical protein